MNPNINAYKYNYVCMYPCLYCKGDIGCLDIDVPCSVNPDQAICKYRSQIAVFKMDAEYATGPVTAR